jgi:hypothetical protein
MKKFIIISLYLISISNCFAKNIDNIFYYGGELGYSRVKDYTNEISKNFTDQFGGSVTVSQSSNVNDLRFFSGLNINKYFDIELGISATDEIKMSIYGKTKDGTNYSGQLTSYYGGLDYSAILKPFADNTLKNLYFRIGATYFINNDEITAKASNSSANVNIYSTEDKSGTGYILGLGYNFPIDETLTFRASWTHLGKIAGISKNYSNRISIGLLEKF